MASVHPCSGRVLLSFCEEYVAEKQDKPPRLRHMSLGFISGTQTKLHKSLLKPASAAAPGLTRTAAAGGVWPERDKETY
ncbi:hypothetical protein E2C01_093579 [Portunus trituberculatus]|uniref:Uncharacterized protein n=1 Tax=Portunus trituberculatus TaxID=210409 RepID=A0A5B7JJI5_PORTR|nr:hypothetical protein [Portunus trituberculatus]